MCEKSEARPPAIEVRRPILAQIAGTVLNPLHVERLIRLIRQPLQDRKVVPAAVHELAHDVHDPLPVLIDDRCLEAAVGGLGPHAIGLIEPNDPAVDDDRSGRKNRDLLFLQLTPGCPPVELRCLQDVSLVIVRPFGR